MRSHLRLQAVKRFHWTFYTFGSASNNAACIFIISPFEIGIDAGPGSSSASTDSRADLRDRYAPPRCFRLRLTVGSGLLSGIDSALISGAAYETFGADSLSFLSLGLRGRERRIRNDLRVRQGAISCCRGDDIVVLFQFSEHRGNNNWNSSAGD